MQSIFCASACRLPSIGEGLKASDVESGPIAALSDRSTKCVGAEDGEEEENEVLEKHRFKRVGVVVVRIKCFMSWSGLLGSSETTSVEIEDGGEDLRDL